MTKHPQTSLESIRYTQGSLSILNQLLLPKEYVYEDCSTVEKGFAAIREMKVRGAPAIAIVAALCLACEIQQKSPWENLALLKDHIFRQLDFLCTSRPTAVNLFKMKESLKFFVEAQCPTLKSELYWEAPRILVQRVSAWAEHMLQEDIANNKAIGSFGAACFAEKKEVTLLTHCNTGSLATAGYGTALGIVRSLHAEKKIKMVFCTETRPYNQGARLTAFELAFERIPGTLIADSMASFLMKTQHIDGVVVGADRVTANGDTANKIGTYQLALAAAYHRIPFYVAAPSASIDCSLATGSEIRVEERPANELTHLGSVQIAANGVEVWNPSFDVTPASLITAIVTERGVIKKQTPDGDFAVASFLAQDMREEGEDW